MDDEEIECPECGYEGPAADDDVQPFCPSCGWIVEGET
ncbi:anaerobic ribonucleoside-triphosphate reductase [Diaphorobacter caeni]|nr:anaerobic ribonucleoside-triphosphate reductase [Diaphorobacter caeni]